MLTFETMLCRYTVIRDKAEAVRRTRITRALAAARAAGVGDSLGTAGHNAMIAFRAGKPWPEINYPELRRALWLMERSFAPGRIAQRAYTRLYDTWRADGFRYDQKA